MTDEYKGERLSSDLIVDRLLSWGCDVTGTLPRFGGKIDFYCKLLYDVDEEKGFEQLGEDLARGNINDAFDKAHMLKGVLANMGLTPMYDKTCQIVEILRVGKLEGTDEYYKNLMLDKTKFNRILYKKDV